ncbi:MAG: hypothetical protein Q9195_001458 [Heterodermia aff. obscurata]
MMEHDFPQSSQPPDIFTAAFDPFSGYSANTNTGMISEPSPEAPGLVYCHTPRSTNLPSHRSSISSYSSSEASFHGNQDVMYTPKVKVEEASEWYPSPNEPVLSRSLITQGLTSYANGVSPVSAPSEDLYRPVSEWPRPEAAGYPLDLHSTDDGRRATFDNAPVLPSVTRTKKKRQRTTPEEATHECRVCGKLFKRSYNWKSHMETHNPERKYPHPCTHMNGNTLCTKKFQRKTDLDRHVDSVIFAPCQATIALANQESRSTSKRAITAVRCAETASLDEIRCGDTRKTGVRSVSKSAFVKLQPWLLLDGLFRISQLAIEPTA